MKKKTAVVLAVLTAGALAGSCGIKYMGYHVFAKGEEDFRIDGSTLTAYLGNDTFVSIPDYVTDIGKGAFSKNSTLQSVELPENLETIEYNAFGGCTALQDITLPETVVKVGPGVFNGCTALSSVEIGSKVSSWGSGVFNDCTSLSKLLVDEENLYLTYYNGALYNGDMSFLYQVLPGREGENYVMPEEVAGLDTYAFWSLQKVKNVKLSENLKQIPAFSMSNMGSVENVILSESVTAIDEKAFANNTSLKQVMVTDKVTGLENKAFSNCPNVKLLVNKGSEAESFAKKQNIPVIYEAEYPTDFVNSNVDLEEKPSKTVTVVREQKITADEEDEEQNETSEPIGTYEHPLDVQEEGVIGKTIIAGGNAVVLIGESNQKVYGLPSGGADTNSSDTEQDTDADSSDKNESDKQDTVADNSDKHNTVTVSTDKNDSDKQDSDKNESANTDTADKTPADDKYSEKDDNKSEDKSTSKQESSVEEAKFDESQIIDERKYYKQNNLTNFKINEKIKKIRRLAFARSGLTSITIPENVETIGYGAFYACEDLEEVSIADSVTTIETKAFADTPWLKNWMGGANVAGDGSDFLIVGDGILLAYRGSKSSIVIPDTVKQIGSEAFKGHTEIKEVTIPESVTMINAEAFRNCTALSTVNGCKGVKTIIRGAFYGTNIDEDSLR